MTYTVTKTNFVLGKERKDKLYSAKGKDMI